MLKYPRDSVIGEYDENCSSMEQEEKITAEYFKKNKPRHENAVKEFIDNYKEGENTAIDTLKQLSPTQFNNAYWGYEQLYNVGYDKKNVKEIGKILNFKGGFQLMVLSHYLFSWDIKAGGMCIGSYNRVIELWWDGIGDWLG